MAFSGFMRSRKRASSIFLTFIEVDFCRWHYYSDPCEGRLRNDRVTEDTYGRGQLEWALWCAFKGERCEPGDVPRIFRTRIKRLLEIDRDLDLSHAEVPPEADHVFAPPPSLESGETAYRAVDVFCLAIALDLLDAGFKQREIVFLMRYLRPHLEDRYPELLGPPSLINRQRYRAQDHPDLPSYQVRGKNYADGRMFIILQKVELTEITAHAGRRQQTEPIILEPVFCAGITDLADTLADMMPNRRRAVTILEVAATAQRVQAFLKDAPLIRRGRPKG